MPLLMLKDQEKQQQVHLKIKKDQKCCNNHFPSPTLLSNSSIISFSYLYAISFAGVFIYSINLKIVTIDAKNILIRSTK